MMQNHAKSISNNVFEYQSISIEAFCSVYHCPQDFVVQKGSKHVQACSDLLLAHPSYEMQHGRRGNEDAQEEPSSLLLE